MSAQPEAPFFLSLHYTAPHWPWEARDDAARAPTIKNNLFDLASGNIHVYRRMIHHMDEGIGRLMAALERTGLADTTLVVFTSGQRRRALLRQLAAGGRQDGPHRGRHPGALDRPLAGRHRARRHQRAALHDDGLVGDDARGRRCGRPCRLSARRRLAAAGAARPDGHLRPPAALAHEPPRPAGAARTAAGSTCASMGTTTCSTSRPTSASAPTSEGASPSAWRQCAPIGKRGTRPCRRYPAMPPSA